MLINGSVTSNIIVLLLAICTAGTIIKGSTMGITAPANKNMRLQACGARFFRNTRYIPYIKAEYKVTCKK